MTTEGHERSRAQRGAWKRPRVQQQLLLAVQTKPKAVVPDLFN